MTAERSIRHYDAEHRNEDSFLNLLLPPIVRACFHPVFCWSTVGIINNKALRLFVAVVLFTGWIAYLGYAALTKSHSPIVSHAQEAAAPIAVVAELETNQDGKPSSRAKVVESLTPNGPAKDSELLVLNLSEVRGFEGNGPYLLLLVPDMFLLKNSDNPQDAMSYSVVGQQRSPGSDLTGVGKPAVYRWNDDVRKQYEKNAPKK
jgi:hypothetical protein